MSTVFKKQFQDLSLNDLKNAFLSEQKEDLVKRHLEKDFKLALNQDAFLENVSNKVGNYIKNRLVVPNTCKRPAKQKTQRVLNILLSDLHFGADLDPDEVPLKYGKIEESRRFASVCQQVFSYKEQYRKETRLNVHLAGDIIQGQLHDQRDGAPMQEQVARAIYLLSCGISLLASQFPLGVTVYCTPGNHGRLQTRHKERAVNQRWDSIENIIYYAIKKSLEKFTNVKFVIPRTPYYVYESFGDRGFVCHGDSTLKPGYPGSSLNIANIRKQINEINASEHNLGRKGYKLFAIGHVHIGSLVHLPNGAIFLSNGCLIPPDAYGLSIGSLQVSCGQWLWESVDGHFVGDHRFVTVDYNTDKDTSLDKIIKPFHD